MFSHLISFFPTLDSFHIFNPEIKPTQSLDSTSQCLSAKEEIKAGIQQHRDDPEALDTFLRTHITCGCEKDPQETLELLADLIDLELLEALIRFKTKDTAIPYQDIFTWASLHRPLCPKPHENSFRQVTYLEFKKICPFVFSFISNILNIFLEAFSFLDSQKKFTTLWDKYLLLDIVYKFFVIPYCLIKLLEPILMTPLKVYLVAALVILSSGILLGMYQRWLKPIPDEIVYCTNLDKQMKKGNIDPKIPTVEIPRVIELLLAKRDILLIGHSGEGKTSIVHQLVELKAKGALDKDLQKLNYFENDCSLMVSSLSFGHAELINQMKEHIADNEENFLIYFDKFYHLVKNEAAFLAFKGFLDEKPHPRCIASMTFQEFEVLKTMDTDGSFIRRMVPLIVNPDDNGYTYQLRLILEDFVHREAKDVIVTDRAITKVITLSGIEPSNWPPEGSAAKAKEILENAMGVCRACYSPEYFPYELNVEKLQFKLLEGDARSQDLKPDPFRLRRAQETLSKIEKLEKKLIADKEQVKKIKHIRDTQLRLQENYCCLTHWIASAQGTQQQTSPSSSLVSDKAKKTYLLYYFYGIDAIKHLLEQEIDKIKDRMNVQVDEKLVQRVFDEAKAVKDTLYAPKHAPKTCEWKWNHS